MVGKKTMKARFKRAKFEFEFHRAFYPPIDSFYLFLLAVILTTIIT